MLNLIFYFRADYRCAYSFVASKYGHALAVPAVDVGDGEGLAFGGGRAMDDDVSDLSHALPL